MKLISLKPIVKKGAIALLVVCLLIAVPVFGQSGGDYDLSWSTIDGGGGVSSGGQYILTGTIGQPDVGYMTRARYQRPYRDYELSGGFWSGVPVCIVDFYHFARFAEHWLDTPCDELNNWCGGADLNQMNGVDFVDLRQFVDEWLYYCPYDWPLK